MWMLGSREVGFEQDHKFGLFPAVVIGLFIGRS